MSYLTAYYEDEATRLSEWRNREYRLKRQLEKDDIYLRTRTVAIPKYIPKPKVKWSKVVSFAFAYQCIKKIAP